VQGVDESFRSTVNCPSREHPRVGHSRRVGSHKITFGCQLQKKNGCSPVLHFVIFGEDGNQKREERKALNWLIVESEPEWYRAGGTEGISGRGAAELILLHRAPLSPSPNLHPWPPVGRELPASSKKPEWKANGLVGPS
jgi:hypothetical protein